MTCRVSAGGEGPGRVQRRCLLGIWGHRSRRSTRATDTVSCRASEQTRAGVRAARVGIQDSITIACTADERRMLPSKSKKKGSPRMMGI